MEKKLRVLGSRVMVEQLIDTPKSDIVIPEESVDSFKKPRGTVIAVGTSEEIASLELQEGDTVYFNLWAGERLEFEGKIYCLLRPEELLAVESI
jgi:co-chaperonin GroES (HSP10)